MKYLLVLIVVGVFYLYWKKQRARVAPPSNPKKKTSAQPLQSPQPMLRCAHCGLHLPAKDAVRDASELPYCSDAHRQQGAA